MIIPPKIFETILKNFLPVSEQEHLLGCYQELFSELGSRRSKFAALIWYLFQIFLAASAVVSENLKWGILMFKNFLKLSFRQLIKQKLFSVINISGLTIGFAVFLLTLMYSDYELSFDDHLKDGDKMYRLIQTSGESRTPIFFSGMPDILRTNDKSLDMCGTDFYSVNVMKSEKKLIATDEIFFAEENVFDYFDIELVKGAKSEAIKSPYSIIISEKIAKTYFPLESPIGKEIEINNAHKFFISGIFKDIPETSHLRTDFIASFNTYKKIFPRAFKQETMSRIHIYTKANEAENEKNVAQAATKYMREREWIHQSEKYNCILQPVKDIHLYSAGLSYDKARGSSVYVYSSLLAGVFVLVLALFNYINLSEAKNLIRIKEFAIRKVIGSDNLKIFIQFLAENFLFVFISLLLAILLAGLGLQKFNELTMRSFSFADLFQFKLLIITLLTSLLIVLVVSLFPLIKTSRANIAEIIFNRTSLLVFKHGFRISPKQILITIQVAITIVIFAGFIVVQKQMTYVVDKNPGYNEENIVVVSNPPSSKRRQRYERIKSELLNKPGITVISSMNNVPGSSISNYCSAYKKGKSSEEAVGTGIVNVDYNTFNLLGSQIIEGRNFKLNSEYDAKNSILINETAAKTHNIKGTGDEILEGIWGSEGPQHVVGVVEDIYTKGFYEKVEPIIYRVRNWSCTNILIKINSENVSQTVGEIEMAWKKISPEWPFSFSFLDEKIDKLYKQDQALMELLKIFSIISILLNVIGIFGVVSFALVRKTKEIGIRKVLGAKNKNIFDMVAKEYIAILVVANLAALPLIYFVMTKWLDNFAYKTDLNIWFLLLATVLSFTVTLVTVGIKSISAANSNPVDSIRTE
ncbi:MAG: ABC transporter permease [Rhodothermaceae bacterium]